MSEQDAATGVEGPLNDPEGGYFNVLLSDEAARNLPTRIFLKEGPAFVISPRMDLPAFLRTDDVGLVVVSVEEYEELRACRSQVLAGPETHPTEPELSLERRVFNGQSPIDRFPAMARFLKDSLGRLTLDEAVTQCGLLFGEDKAPSKSGVHRFWDRLRHAMAADQDGKEG